MQISYLADQPQFIDTLARWTCEFWQPYTHSESIEDRIGRFRNHLNRITLPVAWVAHDRAEVYGVASLREHDLPGREDLSPWLGGVFVGENYRGRGIGKALCRMVERQFHATYGDGPLYLFTLDAQQWYRGQGWELYGPCTWYGHAGDILRKEVRHEP